MKQPLPVIAITLPFLLSYCAEKKDANDLKTSDAFLYDEGIYYENIANPTAESYDLDNKIYTIDKDYIYTYWHIENGDSLKVRVPPIGKEPGEYPDINKLENGWTLVSVTGSDSLITHLHLIPIDPASVEHQNSMQSMVNYDYYSDSVKLGFSETTGLIENKMNTWLHPFRMKYFKILEIDPFPFIQQPFEVGHTWHWNLSVGQQWGDPRWKRWQGNIENEYTYQITDRREMVTPLGKLDVFVVDATADSRIGTTSLRSYYNERYGFVRLEYTNINCSQTIVELEEVREVSQSKDEISKK